MSSRNHRKLSRRRWAWVRRKVLTRDNWRCRLCGKYGNEVDHKIPLQKGGAAWSESNLQVLCRDCHITKTAGENSHDQETIAARRDWAELEAQILRK